MSADHAAHAATLLQRPKDPFGGSIHSLAGTHHTTFEDLFSTKAFIYVEVFPVEGGFKLDPLP